METTIGLGSDRSIETFDAIVMGKFNAYFQKQHNYFQSQMLNYSQTLPGVDFVNIPPPSIENLTMIYNGPVLAVSTFALAGQRNIIASTERAKQTKMSYNRTNINIGFLGGRKHIQAIGLECGSKLKKKACVIAETETPMITNVSVHGVVIPTYWRGML